MSKNELLESYASGRIGRRAFIRGLVGLGATLTVAATFATALRPTRPAAGQEYYEYYETPTPTVTPSPSPTATATAEPTATSTPEPTATTAPPPDQSLTVNGDPRFPVTGNASTGSGNTYELGDGPANGTITVAPDGSFVFVPNNSQVTGDTFTIVVTDSTGATYTITVTIVLVVDKTVSTQGNVGRGTGTGKSGWDPRTSPRPTEAPEKDEEEPVNPDPRS